MLFASFAKVQIEKSSTVYDLLKLFLVLKSNKIKLLHQKNKINISHHKIYRHSVFYIKIYGYLLIIQNLVFNNANAANICQIYRVDKFFRKVNIWLS